MNSLPYSSRRHFLQTTGLSIIGWPFASAMFSGTSTALAQTAATTAASAGLLPLNRFPRMMQDWLIDQVRAAETRGAMR